MRKNITWAQVSLFFFALWACTGSIYWLLGNDQAARLVAIVFWPSALTAAIVALVEAATRPQRSGADAGAELDDADLPPQDEAEEPLEVTTAPAAPGSRRLAFRCAGLQAGDAARLADPAAAGLALPVDTEGEVASVDAAAGTLQLRVGEELHELSLAAAADALHLLASPLLPAMQITLSNGERWSIHGDGMKHFLLAYADHLTATRAPDRVGDLPARDSLVRAQQQLLGASREPVQWLLEQPWDRIEGGWARRVVDANTTASLWRRARVALVRPESPAAPETAAAA